MIVATTKVVAKVTKHSKAQLHILSMYREMMRLAKSKDESISNAIKSSFRQNSTIPKKNILLVEFHIRQAEKKLQLLKETNVTHVRG